MSESNEQVITDVVAKFEKEGLPVPFSMMAKGNKLSDDEQMIMHVFLDHAYLAYRAMKQARKELKKYNKDNKSPLTEGLLKHISTGVDQFGVMWEAWASEVTPLPTLDEIKKFRKILEAEAEKAMKITTESLEKSQEEKQPLDEDNLQAVAEAVGAGTSE